MSDQEQDQGQQQDQDKFAPEFTSEFAPEASSEVSPEVSPAEAAAPDENLTEVLEDTLTVLNDAIDRLESIVTSMEAGEADWEESVRLLTEANELAVSSSQRLDRVVQDVVYGGAGGGPETGETAASQPLEGFEAAEAPEKDQPES